MGQPAKERDILVCRESMLRNSPALFTFYLTLVPFGVGALLLLNWWLRCRGTTLTITNRRSILRRGLIGRSTTEVMHAHVRNVLLSQSVFQRLFGVGSLGISSAGQSGIEIVASGIADPQGTKDVIDFYRDNPESDALPPTAPIARALTGFAAFAAGVFVLLGVAGMIAAGVAVAFVVAAGK